MWTPRPPSVSYTHLDVYKRQVADICEKVGYSDVRYFTKTFTKYSGLKPNEYRKLYS